MCCLSRRSKDAARLWRVWVLEWGGEGIVLKDRRSVYRPGTRSRARWRSKNKITLLVEVLQCAPELVRWGDWGQACVMVFAYREPCPACQQDLWEGVAGELWRPPVASEAMPRDSG